MSTRVDKINAPFIRIFKNNANCFHCEQKYSDGSNVYDVNIPAIIIWFATWTTFFRWSYATIITSDAASIDHDIIITIIGLFLVLWHYLVWCACDNIFRIVWLAVVIYYFYVRRNRYEIHQLLMYVECVLVNYSISLIGVLPHSKWVGYYLMV